MALTDQTRPLIDLIWPALFFFFLKAFSFFNVASPVIQKPHHLLLTYAQLLATSILHWTTVNFSFHLSVYGCDSWTIKKAKGRRIDVFELWYWRRLLRVPWTARRSNQSILKEINPEYSLEGLMLKLQYFGHLMQRANSLEKKRLIGKDPVLGKIEGRRRGNRGWDGWMASPTQWTWVWAKSGVLEFTGLQIVPYDLATEQQWK